MATDQSLSRQELAEGYLLTTALMQRYADNYLGDEAEDAGDPYVSPLFMENLSNLPPAIIVVAEYDPLRDEGVEYAMRLKEAGNFVDLRREQGMIHAFFWMGGAIDRGRELLDELGQDLRQALLKAEMY
jgi:acetyl esterase